MERFRGLPQKQHDAFEQIAVGNDRGHHNRTLAALERKGLIVSYREPLGGNLSRRYERIPLIMTHFQVPLPIHMEWCQWCEETTTTEENE